MRKYTLNESVFENIKTEEQAYWIGFITADGCISRNRHGNYIYLVISLNIQDRNHLEKFATFLGYDGPIHEYSRVHKDGTIHGYSKDNNYSKIVVSSRKITDDLRKLGITERKTFTVKPWNGPERLMKHYWRGILDGDGTLFIEKNGVPRIRFNGTEAIVNNFAEYSGEISGTTAKVFPYKNIFTQVIGGTQKVGSIVDDLYGNCHIALTRKHNIAREISSKFTCQRAVA